jgi:hypothetical protein
MAASDDPAAAGALFQVIVDSVHCDEVRYTLGAPALAFETYTRRTTDVTGCATPDISNRRYERSVLFVRWLTSIEVADP